MLETVIMEKSIARKPPPHIQAPVRSSTMSNANARLKGLLSGKSNALPPTPAPTPPEKAPSPLPMVPPITASPSPRPLSPMGLLSASPPPMEVIEPRSQSPLPALPTKTHIPSSGFREISETSPDGVSVSQFALDTVRVLEEVRPNDTPQIGDPEDRSTPSPRPLSPSR
jgi:hypothetical protein